MFIADERHFIDANNTVLKMFGVSLNTLCYFFSPISSLWTVFL